MTHHIVKDWRGTGKAIAVASFLFSLLIFLSIPQTALAANGDDGNGRTDYDLDDDGLIEINDLADLDEIRNNLDGTTFYAASTGCPAEGCNGFELTTDLDFDTNQDGVMDVNDDYWNFGSGWSPIGSSSTPFTGIFEGNGHVISNLYINRPSTDYVGLFGGINNAQIRQLGLSGSLMSVTGDDYVGGLVGRVGDNNIINAIYNTGSVVGSDDFVGGLAGYVNRENQISASYNTGSVIGSGSYVGGLLGRCGENNQITASYSSGYVSGASTTGGLISSSYSSASDLSTTITNSYWAIDSSGQTTSYGSSEITGYVGLTLATLQCATNLSVSGCVSSDEGLNEALILYEDWGSSGYWDFGTSEQLPGLILSGVVHRDSDGDGSLDENDAFPNERAASLDQDGDGYPDIWTLGCDDTCIALSGLIFDQFPALAAVGQDSDYDGLADVWAAECDSACQSASGLTLDTYLNDTDNDGIMNVNDSDDNGDGITDVDTDNNGLIEISTLTQLDAIRYQLDGTGYRASSDAELDQSGCPFIVYQGSYQQSCSGFELINDLDFDTNQDGVINANDDYWNEGEGWSPIGSSYLTPFTGTFEGNGYVINNLTINRPSTSYQGLFGYITNAQIRQLGLSGALMSVMGKDYVGALVGYVNDNNIIHAIYNAGSVTGVSSVGGLFGHVDDNNQISNSFNTGSVIGSSKYVGGLVGYVDASNQISTSYNRGLVSSSSSYIGGLVGYVYEGNQVTATYNTGSVTSSSAYVGGLAGYIGSTNQISTSYSTGSVISLSQYVGGLIGRIESSSQIIASYSSGYVSGIHSVGGLIGSNASIAITSSYWVTDSSGQTTSSSSSENRGYVGLTLAILQCAIDANTDASNSECVSADGSNEGLSAGMILYEGWESSGYWDFGDGQQLPGLLLNGVVHRDSDGDGLLDEYDDFPNQRAASVDSDNDGSPESWTAYCDDTCIAESNLGLDQFPDSSAAWQDSDLDGLVDAWVEGCDDTCQDTSGFILDAYLNDTDNDGITNDIDNDDNGDGIVDIDADSNGLIEISTLAQLNAIRYQLDGSGYRTSSDAWLDQSGCPSTLHQGTNQLSCSGYELINDLDFDTNQDGVMDVNDDYWNANEEGIGEGWVPIGSYSAPFSAIFEGNGYGVNNLFINRSSMDDVGLFGFIKGAQIRQLGLSGALMSVTGSRYVGALAGAADENSLIVAIYNTGAVTGSSNVGGLIGAIDKSQISNSFNTGSVIGTSNFVGGLVGYIYSNNQITASYNSGYVRGLSSTGGLIGVATSLSSINNSYWAIDSSGQAISSYSNGGSGYVGLALATLQCAVEADTDVSNSDCVSADGSDEGLSSALTLYADWQDSGYWDFGDDLQLPGLILNGVVYRDSDGDGSLDEHDAFHLNPAASIDNDNDGYPDSWVLGCDDTCTDTSGLKIDQFPDSAAGGLDSDLDGLVDTWATNCDATCQSESGLVLDAYLDDTDNDGITNDNDSDDNGDGLSDVDADSNGLIEITTLAQLDAIRYQLDGNGYRSTSDAELDQSGCPVMVYQGHYQARCSGYELSNDLDFDTNHDGVIDAGDYYWNEGEGWVPIGNYSAPFTGVFEGNGHVISNLVINRSSSTPVGLFGAINNAEIRHIGLSGSLMSVMGDESVGGLVGYVKDNNIINAVYNTGPVIGSDDRVGGLVGYVGDSNQISNSYNTGSVTGNRFVGGLTGYVYSNNQITASYSSGYVSGVSYTGGLIGYSSNSASVTTINNSYWAMDSSSQTTSADSLEDTGYVGLTLFTLKCAVVANTDASNSSCVSADGTDEGLSAALNLYANWEVSGYWDFGDSQQLPSLILSGVVHRDSDGDGSLDANDAYPLISTGELTDTDNDGIPNDCDQVCIDSGMVTDTDDDNDGVLDAEDAYSLISIGNLADTDNDGIPNDCEQACIDSGMVADSDDDNDGVLDAEDGYPLIAIGGLTDTDNDGIPNDCDLACLETGMIADVDDDNDGVLDDADAYRLISLGALTDTDGDGIPNQCDVDCLSLGMAEDLDDDNDGLPDLNDGFSLIAIGELTDSDNDGRPDDCDQACIDAGMAADTDDDNDGVLDINDEYRLISLNGNADFDGDGIPDNCAQACIDTGMASDTDIDNDGVLNADDAFDFDANESNDFDLDGLGDNADTDDDNDGVLDADDPELGADNGAPELIAIADDASLSVTTENGFNALVIIDDDYMLAFVATDMVDNDLRFEATLNGSVLTKDENDQVLLPAGNLSIFWVAIDDAGNRSNSLTQNVKVYPRVSFTIAESIIGEASDALIEVALSGESPVYPVTIELEIDSLSEVDQNDLSDSFDISGKHQVVIERGDDESAPNTQVNFVIPVIDDGINENDELLVVNLNGVIVAEDEENFYEVHETLNQHSLTVTYQNLAPVVQLLLEQGGVEVSNVTQDGGVVTVTALITDGNGNDTHTLVWDLNSLGLNVPLGNVLTFSPANLAVGEYSLSVEATDNGITPLSGLAQLSLSVTAPRATEPDDGAATGDSSGGGGGTMWWILFVLAGISLQAKRRRNFN